MSAQEPCLGTAVEMTDLPAELALASSGGITPTGQGVKESRGLAGRQVQIRGTLGPEVASRSLGLHNYHRMARGREPATGTAGPSTAPFPNMLSRCG